VEQSPRLATTPDAAMAAAAGVGAAGPTTKAAPAAGAAATATTTAVVSAVPRPPAHRTRLDDHIVDFRTALVGTGAAFYRLQGASFDSLSTRRGSWFWADANCNLTLPDGATPRGHGTWDDLLRSVAATNRWTVRVASPLRVWDARPIPDIGARLFDARADDSATIDGEMAAMVESTGLDGFVRVHCDGLEELWVTHSALRKLTVVAVQPLTSRDAIASATTIGGGGGGGGK